MSVYDTKSVDGKGVRHGSTGVDVSVVLYAGWDVSETDLLFYESHDDFQSHDGRVDSADHVLRHRRARRVPSDSAQLRSSNLHHSKRLQAHFPDQLSSCTLTYRHATHPSGTFSDD